MSGSRPDEVTIRCYGESPEDVLCVLFDRVVAFARDPTARCPMYLQTSVRANDGSLAPLPHMPGFEVVMSDPGTGAAPDMAFVAEGKLFVWRAGFRFSRSTPVPELDEHVSPENCGDGTPK